MSYIYDVSELKSIRMIDSKGKKIVEYISKVGGCSSKELFDSAEISVSYATLKRILTNLMAENYLVTRGQGKGTRYFISPVFEVIQPINAETYYEKEIDERKIKEGFNIAVITDIIARNSVFTKDELGHLNELQNTYRKNITQLTDAEIRKEMERLAIDLSWKSSQIEGNTYSLLETERLLREKETAAGKTKEEAVMLLNHKEALDFIIENPDYLNPLTVRGIEDIHSVLTKELAVERNIRKRRIGISGTNYRPLDNEYQILEALQSSCLVINNKESAFEKALLALALISYIQPFMDGNKRTARIVGNAILMHEKHCPLSFRTVDSIDYKKAMILFYEQNNISNFKEIFISQFEFAVRTYF